MLGIATVVVMAFTNFTKIYEQIINIKNVKRYHDIVGKLKTNTEKQLT